MSHPGTLTIVIPVQPEREHPLDEYLIKAGNDRSSPLFAAIASLESVHFARWVLVPKEDEHGPLLAFESNHDGSADEHLDELVRAIDRELDVLLDHCEGYADAVGTEPTLEARRAYLARHVVADVFPYRGHPNLPAKLIKNDLRLKRALARYLDEQRRLGKLETDPVALFEAMRHHASTLDGIDIAPHPRKLPSVFGFYARIVALGLAIVVLATAALTAALHLEPWDILLVGIGVAVGLVVLGYGVYLDFKGYVEAIEERERASSDEARKQVMTEPDRRMRPIFYSEDRQTQNALTHLVAVKEDPQRQFVLSVMLLAVKLLACTLYVHGKLGPIDSIHCARWIRIDGGKRLLFFSNYDGSWESYLGEFVDKLSFWLTAVWSNTQGFPTTKNMFHAGAEDEEWFKRWTRNRQLYTHLWYAAYPNLSVQNVIANARLREGLSKNLTDKDLRAWLRLV